MVRQAHRMRHSLGLLLFFSPIFGLAQGIDLGTINYEPTFVANLSAPYNESSGLVFLNDTIYSINDSGNTPAVHALLSSDGSHVHSWTVANAQNLDWEAMTQNSAHLFIADVGNNMGTRTALDIYVIPKEELNTTNTLLSSQKQSFKLAGQPTTGLQMNAHNFDCEALFYWQDSLHLFTKNWENLWTKHYVLPTSWQDTLVVSAQDSFDVNGLITDAAIDSVLHQMYLLGYKKEPSGLYSAFMYRFASQSSSFFEGDYQRIELGSTLTLAQTEGICVSGGAQGFISGEKITSILTIAPKLHQFDFSTLTSGPTLDAPAIYFHEHILYIPKDLLKEFKLIDTSGRNVIDWQLGKNHQDLGHLKPGSYFLIGPNYRRTWVKTN